MNAVALKSLKELPGDQLLKTKEVAEYLGITGGPVAEMVATGKLKGIRLPIARGLRVRVEDLRDFLEKRSLPMNRDHPIVRARAATAARRKGGRT